MGCASNTNTFAAWAATLFALLEGAELLIEADGATQAIGMKAVRRPIVLVLLRVVGIRRLGKVDRLCPRYREAAGGQVVAYP
jgi:hypothetical protein